MSSLKFDWLFKLTFKYMEAILQFFRPQLHILMQHVFHDRKDQIFSTNVLLLLFSYC